MDIITIDPSLTCTAMCIGDEYFVYASDSTAMNKSGWKSWFGKLENRVHYRIHEAIDRTLSHTQSEINKLNLFDNITTHIIDDIRHNIFDYNCIISIEGFSYSSANQSIIDLVSFVTLLKYKLLTQIKLHTLIILPPSTIKIRACELVYGVDYNDNGKKIISRNNDDVAGGNFKKREMMQSILDMDKKDWYTGFLNSEKDNIFNLKSIPKPIEDINDAKITYEIILDKLEKNNYDLKNLEHELMN